ncbi:MAG: LruC domain-containing protein [Bacteroidaceae bacterium]|nr:LruC domain-containing protein [Bacteroidaceae bacterium]
MRKYILLATIATALVFASCSTDNEISENKRIQNAFCEMIGDEIGPLQWWHTAVRLKVSIKNVHDTIDITAYSSDNDKQIIYDYKQICVDSTFYMTLPQSANRQFYLLAKTEKQTVSKEITLTGKTEQSVEIEMPLQLTDITKSITRSDLKYVQTGSSLYGKDILPNIGYTEVDRKGIETVIDYTEEGMDVIQKNYNVNYELISQGPFNVTMYYGFTGCYEPRILGYYRHSPGTYEDLEFVDMLDTHSYDYINGKAKLQYQLDGQTDTWYDSNFDYRDGYYAPFTTVADRLGDDVYNIQYVIERYGERMTKARGLTYRIDVKPGDRIGFYLKMAGRTNAAQREKDVRLGLPSSNLPSPMYETNWSAQVLNTDGKHRSVLIQDNGYTIMGMEDANSTGDFDCNDVLFGLHADMESEMPIIAIPDIDGLLTNPERHVWTIAYEDSWRDRDFDFNDAVIKISPNYENETCDITLMAVGSTAKMYLHYDGPDGDQNLGEIHQLFGRSSNTKINTLSTNASISFVEIENVKWPRNYTIAEDAKRFYIEVQRGTCQDCSDLLTLPSQPGVTPQAILVSGSWRWPLEGNNISSVYNYFSPWATDITNTYNWGWHTSPQPNTFVNY